MLLNLRLLFVASVPANNLLDAAYAADRSVIPTVFDWERDRVSTLSKGAAGTATTILITALAAAFDDSDAFSGGGLALILTSSISLYAWATSLAISLQRVGGMYAATLARIGAGG